MRLTCQTGNFMRASFVRKRIAMNLDLTEVLRGPGHAAEREIAIAAGTLDEWELTQPVTGVVRAVNARRNIIISGSGQTAVEMECSRCLENYSQPLEFELDVVVPLSHFNPLLGAAAVEEEDEDGQELTKEDIAALFQGHDMDVDELVRQAIVLSAPIQPLCAADCAGLPEAASHRDGHADSRWAALQKLGGK